MNSFLQGIKIFADGADLPSILKLNQEPHIQGFTTNPTLMSKAGIKDYEGFAKEVLQEVKKPISFEVFSDDLDKMKRQALKIAAWGENVYVKIPITNTQEISTVPLMHDLSHQGVKINGTAIFTRKQIQETTEALKGGAKSVVSVFAGRIFDSGIDATHIMIEALSMCKRADQNIELLWASPRELFNIVQAKNIGCHIITVPHDLLSKVHLFGKDLGQFSLETVQMFFNDAQKSGFSL